MAVYKLVPYIRLENGVLVGAIERGAREGLKLFQYEGLFEGVHIESEFAFFELKSVPLHLDGRGPGYFRVLRSSLPGQIRGVSCDLTLINGREVMLDNIPEIVAAYQALTAHLVKQEEALKAATQPQ